MPDTITLALAGNPNCGKSTIFNALTGSRQHVGNWPGKTVEQKTGICKLGNREIAIVDLPGTYSLTAFSAEEVIARDFIIEGQPDVVVSIVDSVNLERNLYLTIQILELGVPVVLALNMSDLADQNGLTIDAAKLSKGLQGIPVVRTAASKKQGVDELLQAAVALADSIGNNKGA